MDRLLKLLIRYFEFDYSERLLFVTYVLEQVNHYLYNLNGSSLQMCFE